MEKRHDQQQLDSPKPSASGQLHPNQQMQRFTAESLARLLEARPMLFWSGLWVSMLLVAMVSVSSLLSPGLTGGQTAAIDASPAEAAQQMKQQSRVPLWLFGAIALSCTAGSLLISKQLAPPRSRSVTRRRSRTKLQTMSPPSARKTRKRLKPYSPADAPFPLAVHPTAQTPYSASAAIPQPLKLPPQLSVPSQAPGRLRRVTLPGPKAATSRPSTAIRPTTVAKPMTIRPTEVSVTVVPADENHPLDWKTASLADSLDLRRRHSLSSWL